MHTRFFRKLIHHRINKDLQIIRKCSTASSFSEEVLEKIKITSPKLYNNYLEMKNKINKLNSDSEKVEMLHTEAIEKIKKFMDESEENPRLSIY